MRRWLRLFGGMVLLAVMTGCDNMAANSIERFLSGDFSVISDESYREQAEGFFGHGDWEYVLLDLDGDEVNELFLRWADNTFLFHPVGDALICWEADMVEMTCFNYPLTDGTVVTQYNYGGGTTYTLKQYHTDGSYEVGDQLYIRMEPSLDTDARPCPYYSLNDREMTETEYEDHLKREILDLQAVLWTQVTFE